MIALQFSDLSRFGAPAASSPANGGRRSAATGKINLRSPVEKGKTCRQLTRAAAEIATEKITSDETQISVSQEPPSIDFAFVSARPLLNCCGGGTCGTCLVEVVDGKELLSPRTEKEKNALKKKPKNWRLACQTTVGTKESSGQIVIQQLPEWKAHEWQK